MGSVKDLVVIKKPTKDALGLGEFVFSDRYSVFDWGEMPDVIKLKGASLALMGAKSFELLGAEGIRMHYLGLAEDGVVKRLSDLKGPSNVMRVRLTNVYKPEYNDASKSYDYSFLSKSGSLDNYLIPLECVYRNGLPLGSSVFKKLEDGKLSLAELGLSEQPKPGDMLPEPLYDFSTKLEESGDRLVKGDELFRISGLTEEEFRDLEDKLRNANELITKHCNNVGLTNYDGKFEFMKYDGIVFADVLGTPDECRFSLGQLQVSKEVIRQWYKKNQPDWALKVDECKKMYGLDWRKVMIAEELVPVSLPEKFLSLVSEMYAACANVYCEREFFNVRPLPVVINELEETGCAIYVK